MQFGDYGLCVCSLCLKNENPKAVILNIGHEEMKGSNNLQAYDKLSNILVVTLLVLLKEMIYQKEHQM